MSSQIVASVPLLDTVHQDFPGGSLRFKQNKRSNTYQIHFSLLISVIIWLQRHASTTLSTYKCPASPKSKPVVGERNDVRFRKEVGTFKVPIASHRHHCPGFSCGAPVTTLDCNSIWKTIWSTYCKASLIYTWRRADICHTSPSANSG
jgi:hypothetical protein